MFWREGGGGGEGGERADEVGWTKPPPLPSRGASADTSLKILKTVGGTFLMLRTFSKNCRWHVLEIKNIHEKRSVARS